MPRNVRSVYYCNLSAVALRRRYGGMYSSILPGAQKDALRPRFSGIRSFLETYDVLVDGVVPLLPFGIYRLLGAPGKSSKTTVCSPACRCFFGLNELLSAQCNLRVSALCNIQTRRPLGRRKRTTKGSFRTFFGSNSDLFVYSAGFFNGRWRGGTLPHTAHGHKSLTFSIAAAKVSLFTPITHSRHNVLGLR